MNKDPHNRKRNNMSNTRLNRVNNTTLNRRSSTPENCTPPKVVFNRDYPTYDPLYRDVETTPNTTPNTTPHTPLHVPNSMSNIYTRPYTPGMYSSSTRSYTPGMYTSGATQNPTNSTEPKPAPANLDQVKSQLGSIAKSVDAGASLTNKQLELMQKVNELTSQIATEKIQQIDTKLQQLLDQISRQSNNNNNNHNNNHNHNHNISYPHHPRTNPYPNNSYTFGSTNGFGQGYQPFNSGYTFTYGGGQPTNPTVQPKKRVDHGGKGGRGKGGKTKYSTHTNTNGTSTVDMTIHFGEPPTEYVEAPPGNTGTIGTIGSTSAGGAGGLVSPFTMLGPILYKQSDLYKRGNTNKGSPSKAEGDESEDEVLVEYNSEDEFEELDIQIKTLDDLITLGKLYDEFIKPPTVEAAPVEAAPVEAAPVEAAPVEAAPVEATPVDYDSDSSDQGSDKEQEITNEINDIMNLVGQMLNMPVMPLNLNKGSKSKRGHKRSDKSKRKNKSKSSKDDGAETGQTSQTTTTDETNKGDNGSEFVLNGKRYSINLKTLNKMIVPLTKLKSLVGLDTVKNSIVDMIIYYLQGFENKNKNMLHTVIEGPPGVGKTELGKILAEIYAALGVIPSNKFKLVKRTDLIGEYLGQTAPKTQKAIDEADGGVLFIDEAYSLGNKEKKDSFAKECIDTINQNLTEKKRKFICIIAGYPDQLDKCFFAYNPGLRRRFPFKFTIDGYQPTELMDIFIKKIEDSKWKINTDELDKDKLTKFFTNNHTNFPHFGGDIENLLVDCKFMHSRRVVGKHPKLRRKLIKSDIDDGLERFKKNQKLREEGPPSNMYT